MPKPPPNVLLPNAPDPNEVDCHPPDDAAFASNFGGELNLLPSCVKEENDAPLPELADLNDEKPVKDGASSDGEADLSSDPSSFVIALARAHSH